MKRIALFSVWSIQCEAFLSRIIAKCIARAAAYCPELHLRKLFLHDFLRFQRYLMKSDCKSWCAFMRESQRMANIAMKGLIKGTVQGVFFRASTLRQAEVLGVTGWVRNTTAGHVEVCIVGEPGRISEMVLWLRHGPARARVTEVQLCSIPAPEISDFQIRS